MGDATLLVPSVRKLLRVVSTVPRLEAFVSATCQAVIQDGAEFLRADANVANPQRVPELLQDWIEELREASRMHQAMVAITAALKQRVEPAAAASAHQLNSIVVQVRGHGQ